MDDLEAAAGPIRLPYGSTSERLPCKRGQGYASHALSLLLLEAEDLGLPWVELTTNLDNIPSQNVIPNNGGYLVEHFTTPAVYGGGENLRYRIDLGD